MNFLKKKESAEPNSLSTFSQGLKGQELDSFAWSDYLFAFSSL